MDLQGRNQKQREFFNSKIDTYDLDHSEFMKTKEAITENLEENVERILDLGAGTGLELISLFEKYPNVKVTVIDISENMLDKLKTRSFANQVTIICGDFFETDFGQDYDAVISTSALHHFKQVEKAILYKKIFDCLKEDGYFINCDRIALTDEFQASQLYLLENEIDKHKHIDTPITVENELYLLKETGFKLITLSDVDKEEYKLIKAIKPKRG